MLKRVNRTLQQPVLRGTFRTSHVEAKIDSLGLKLPTAAIPKGNFINYTLTNNLIFLSGHLPQVGFSRILFSFS
jgi:hypothetical protein